MLRRPLIPHSSLHFLAPVRKPPLFFSFIDGPTVARKAKEFVPGCTRSQGRLLTKAEFVLLNTKALDGCRNDFIGLGRLRYQSSTSSCKRTFPVLEENPGCGSRRENESSLGWLPAESQLLG